MDGKQPEACCACRNVKYDPTKHGQFLHERWRCPSCGTEFVKRPAVESSVKLKDERIADLERALAKAVADVAFYSGQAGYDDVSGKRPVPYYIEQARRELDKENAAKRKHCEEQERENA